MYSSSLPVVAALAGLVLVGVGWIAARNRVLRRQALRNVVRRPGEAALVVLGSLLGTAIIVGSFAVGDSLRASAKSDVYRLLGQIDEQVFVINPADAPRVRDALTSLDGDTRVDGRLEVQVVRAGIAADSSGALRAEPEAGIFDFPLESGADFESPNRSALAGGSPGQGEVVITDRLAETLGVGAGDRISMYPFGVERVLTVTRVVTVEGLSGYAGPPAASGIFRRGENAFVAPGSLMKWWQASAAESAIKPGSPPVAPPVTIFLVSNKGGVEESDKLSDEVNAEMTRLLGPLKDSGVAAELQPIKQISLRVAKAGGDNLGEVFLVVGSFSVLAGILLLVNIFVMLAEERKNELGMLRAIGMNRRQLVRSFVIEGCFYAIEAALLGAALGVVVGRAIVVVASAIFARGFSSGAFSLSFDVTAASVALGATLGFLMSFVTVAVTSLRISRINIIRAIRDLPEPPKKTSIGPMFIGLLLVMAGAAMGAKGIKEKTAAESMMGPSLVIFGLTLLVGRLAPRRLVNTVGAAGVLAWVLLVDPIFHVFSTSENTDFVVMGILLTFAAAILISENQELIAAVLRRIRRANSDAGLALRIGLAYPVARRFRTGMTLLMFGLVIFTLVVIASMARMQEGLVDSLADVEAGGFDIMASSSPARPLANPGDELERGSLGGSVAGTVALPMRLSQVTPPDPSKVKEGFRNTGTGYATFGINQDFIDSSDFGMRDRLPEFDSDRAVWEKLLSDPSSAVIDGGFLSFGGGPLVQIVQPGDTLIVENPATGEKTERRVIGTMKAYMLMRGLYLGERSFADLFGSVPPNIVLIKARDGVDRGALATEINGAYIHNGVQARVYRDVIEADLQINNQFIRLMQGYLGLGLVVGIAGLGVVMVRAVRERRRQIGMLKAIGIPSKVVSRAFMAESTFVALEGIVAGTALGLVTSYNIFRSTMAQQVSDPVFEIPAAEVTVLVLVALLASILFTLWPARSASSIQPAVALRIAD